MNIVLLALKARDGFLGDEVFYVRGEYIDEMWSLSTLEGRYWARRPPTLAQGFFTSSSSPAFVVDVISSIARPPLIEGYRELAGQCK